MKAIETLMIKKLDRILNNWTSRWNISGEVSVQDILGISISVGFPDKLQLFAILDKMFKEQTWICPIEENNVDKDSYYSISKECIVIPKRKDELDEAFYCEMLHNMAHSTGMSSCLGRFGELMSFGSVSYSKEELVSELSAAAIMEAFGFSKPVKDDSLAYLQNWKSLIEEDNGFLDDVIDRASGAINVMLMSIGGSWKEKPKCIEHIIDDESMLEELGCLIHEQMVTDSEPWPRKMRSLIYHWKQNPELVDEVLMDLCGWKMESLLYKL